MIRKNSSKNWKINKEVNRGESNKRIDENNYVNQKYKLIEFLIKIKKIPIKNR